VAMVTVTNSAIAATRCRCGSGGLGGCGLIFITPKRPGPPGVPLMLDFTDLQVASF
jgi:hypothetical protein